MSQQERAQRRGGRLFAAIAGPPLVAVSLLLGVLRALQAAGWLPLSLRFPLLAIGLALAAGAALWLFGGGVTSARSALSGERRRATDPWSTPHWQQRRSDDS